MLYTRFGNLAWLRIVLPTRPVRDQGVLFRKTSISWYWLKQEAAEKMLFLYQ